MAVDGPYSNCSWQADLLERGEPHECIGHSHGTLLGMKMIVACTVNMADGLPVQIQHSLACSQQTIV